MKLNTDVNRSVPFHLTMELEKGAAVLTLNKVVKTEGSKEVTLEPIDQVPINVTSAKELKETTEHLRWQFGKLMKEIAAQEDAINAELKQEAAVPAEGEKVGEEVEQAAA